MPADQHTTDFSAHFETLQLDERVLQASHAATIVPRRPPRLDEPLDRLRTLPRLAVGESTESPKTYPDLTVKGTLGEGGMGLVRLATQVALDRDVAVKTLRAKGDAAGPKLLQEAYVTGRLEHPNIIPIYTLGRDDAGVPLIVMKRIEGVSWLDVLRDASRAPRNEPADLHWHLDILIHVCDALRFAHSHDIIHRDIKPENVMIGLFGEVYLLDWGIAVSIAELDPSGLIPHRDDSSGVAGTPAYMAPEMTDNDAARHDRRTDVYLLGACLHEVLTGEPRHDGKNLFEVMRNAFESEPVIYAADVPAELGAIANRATAQDPADRFQSVEEFRHAILEFIQHRASFELAHTAQRLLADIAKLLKEAERSDERTHRAQELFTECRFAARQALKEWNGNQLAHQALRDCLIEMVEFALQRDDLLGARAAFMELTDPPQPLRERLRALETRVESEKKEFARLRRVARDLDLRTGAKSRSLFMLVVGLAWAATAVWAHYKHTASPEAIATWQDTLISIGRTLGIAALGLVLFRKRLFSNVANRRLMSMVGIVLLGIVIARLVTQLLTVAALDALALEACMYGVAAMAAGVITDPRIIAAGGVYFLVALSPVFAPGLSYLVLAFAHAAYFAWIAWLWSPWQMHRKPSS